MGRLTNMAGRLAASVVALHPLARWVLGRIERERELACDDWVVALTGSARPYAASLARLFELCWTRRRETAGRQEWQAEGPSWASASKCCCGEGVNLTARRRSSE